MVEEELPSKYLHRMLLLAIFLLRISFVVEHFSKLFSSLDWIVQSRRVVDFLHRFFSKKDESIQFKFRFDFHCISSNLFGIGFDFSCSFRCSSFLRWHCSTNNRENIETNPSVEERRDLNVNKEQCFD